jgi:HSP20 family protein
MHEYRRFLREFEEFRIRARHLFAGGHLAAAAGEVAGTGEWAPSVDVYETADSVVLAAEIAGVRREDVSIELEGEVLTLRGRRPPGRAGVAAESYLRMEVTSGAFERSFRLPFAAADAHVEAVLRDGVLTVTVPRSGSALGRHIAVETG